MNLKKNYYIDIFLIFSIFVLDRVSKIYVIYLDEKNFNSEIFLSKFLNIQLIWNEGIAFGLLAFEKGSFYNMITIIISLIVIVIFFFDFKKFWF